MNKLLAIDPGKCCGYAAFFCGELQYAAQGNGYTLIDVIRWADVIVFEHPEIYRSRYMKGDPNDLFPLVKQIGWMQGKARAGTEFFEYLPKAWKGQVPKPVIAARAAKVLGHEPIPLSQHNAWDAIGLGLFHMGRLRLR